MFVCIIYFSKSVKKRGASDLYTGGGKSSCACGSEVGAVQCVIVSGRGLHTCDSYVGVVYTGQRARDRILYTLSLYDDNKY